MGRHHGERQRSRRQATLDSAFCLLSPHTHQAGQPCLPLQHAPWRTGCRRWWRRSRARSTHQPAHQPALLQGQLTWVLPRPFGARSKEQVAGPRLHPGACPRCSAPSERLASENSLGIDGACCSISVPAVCPLPPPAAAAAYHLRAPRFPMPRSVCVAGLALQDALPQAKPSSRHSKLARQQSKASCTLPVLSRQTSGAGAGLSRSSPPPRQFARTASMFVMPDRGTAGPLHRTGSSTLQGLTSSSSNSPRGQHPARIAECSAQLQALALGDSSPAGQLCAGRQSGDPHCSGGGNAAQADALTPLPEEAQEAELAGAGLTERCSAVAHTWSSLQGFSALHVVAQGGRSTVWEAIPNAPDQQDLPGGCWRGMHQECYWEAGLLRWRNVPAWLPYRFRAPCSPTSHNPSSKQWRSRRTARQRWGAPLCTGWSWSSAFCRPCATSSKVGRLGQRL